MARLPLVLFAAMLTLAGCAPGIEEEAEEDESAQTDSNTLEVGSTLETTVRLRLRREADKTTLENVILVMKKGSPVEVVDAATKNGFAHVKYRDEKTQKTEEGWAWRAYLRSATKPAKTETPSTPSDKPTCPVSFYGDEFNENHKTVQGETFDQNAMTAARDDSLANLLPFGKVVRVTNVATKKFVDVRITDSRRLASGQCLDLSQGAYKLIADLKEPAIEATIDR
jgi:rare lipoprotein A (peptidoglycan hydrolase)